MDGRERRECAELGYVCKGDVVGYPGVCVPDCKGSAYVDHAGDEEKAYISQALQTNMASAKVFR